VPTALTGGSSLAGNSKRMSRRRPLSGKRNGSEVFLFCSKKTGGGNQRSASEGMALLYEWASSDSAKREKGSDHAKRPQADRAWRGLEGDLRSEKNQPRGVQISGYGGMKQEGALSPGGSRKVGVHHSFSKVADLDSQMGKKGAQKLRGMARRRKKRKSKSQRNSFQRKETREDSRRGPKAWNKETRIGEPQY